jgi:hypothetical protein
MTNRGPIPASCAISDVARTGPVISVRHLAAVDDVIEPS